MSIQKPPDTTDAPQRKSVPMEKDLTTGQVAKIASVCPQTVVGWLESGELRGHRVPGSKFRRFSRADVLHFMKKNGIPCDDFENENKDRVLLVTSDDTIRGSLADSMEPANSKIESATGGFDAGMQTKSLHPDCAVIDFTIGSDAAVAIARHMRNSRECANTILIALVTDTNIEDGYDNAPFDENFQKPFDTALLAKRVSTLINRKK
jgi:excisionase family DNA binding protein